MTNQVQDAKQQVFNSMDNYSNCVLQLSKTIDAIDVIDNSELANNLGDLVTSVQTLINDIIAHRNEMYASHGWVQAD